MGGRTVQTSTVYGGAGADTIIFGDYTTPGNAQLLKVDAKAFAGADSIEVGGSFVSSTVSAGAGNDTLAINTTASSSTASTATEFYAGAGADSIKIAGGQNITVYADGSAADTAGGVDSLEIAAFTSSTVYGAAGGDTLNVTGAQTDVRIELPTLTTPQAVVHTSAPQSWLVLALTPSS